MITEEGNNEDEEEGMTPEEKEQHEERVGNMLYEDKDFIVQKKLKSDLKATGNS